MNKNIMYSALVALGVSILSFLGIHHYFDSKNTIEIQHISANPSQQAVFTIDDENNVIPLDFTRTADQVIDAVVHIKSTKLKPESFGNVQRPQNIPDPFKDFFGDDFNSFFGPKLHFHGPGLRQEIPQSRVGTGSGVIVGSDGYIMTNDHVIAGADDIEVTLYDNRTYKATIVGTDPTTDLALLQIKETGLPQIPFLDSDQVKIGEWVLAVGNPYSLNSTITAGIVSAKGRNINILKEKYAVEDFIQTDAAINPGNSGGALVNLQGGLMGINTAIASPTGAYSGYGFAVPSNLVKKVMEDLMKYGVVQRGVLGIMIRGVDGNLANEKNLAEVKGVYVDSLLENSAAKEAGIKVGDVILKINDIEVNATPELQGMIARHRPGETISMQVSRGGKIKNYDVTLTNSLGETTLNNEERSEILKVLGASIKDLSKDECDQLKIKSGVELIKLYPGKLRRQTQIKEGLIITHLDGEEVGSKKELIKKLENKTGGVMLEGVYKDIPGKYYYAFGL